MSVLHTAAVICVKYFTNSAWIFLILLGSLYCRCWRRI